MVNGHQQYSKSHRADLIEKNHNAEHKKVKITLNGDSASISICNFQIDIIIFFFKYVN